jgi:uncharacterized protein (TIGR00725 family)
MKSKYQFCVSGAAKGRSVEEGRVLASKAGKAIADGGHGLLTGATIGLPNYAAESYKMSGGLLSIGISPAASKLEHVRKYRLPTESYDSILYTGLNYIGRDVFLISSADAVVSIGGRLGTLHEFTVAMELETPIGFLQGAGGISTDIMDILHAAGQQNARNVIFSDSPEELVAKLTVLLDTRHKDYLEIYQ